VRDCLLGRPIKDVDIAVAADPRAVGLAVKGALGGHFFWLRERDGTARVVRPAPEALQLDIVPLTEPIEVDLRRRDYTINAMAIPVAAGLHVAAPVVDPTGGQADLAARQLRLASAGALEADPLRALRGVRLAVQLSFRLEPATAERLRSAGPWLARVSRERIRDELFLCLAASRSVEALQGLQAFGLLDHVIPALGQIPDGQEWDAALARVEAVGRLIDQLPFPPPLAAAVRARLARPLTPPRDRPALLRLGAVLWDLPAAPAERETDARRAKGSPLRKVSGAAAAIGRELALSGAEAGWLARLLTSRQVPWDWLAAGAPLGRHVYRFWKQAGEAAADTVLLTLAEARDDSLPPRLEPLLTRLLEYERGEHPPLLTGQEVIAVARIAPGPELGALMDELAEAQADGAIGTPAEARQWVAARYNTEPSSNRQER
jgi:tRNA nucleotidyltransferase/poly(A) polymerase